MNLKGLIKCFGVMGGLAFFLVFPLEAKETRGPFLWEKTVTGDFDEVIEGIISAAASRNFPAREVRDYQKSLTERLRQLKSTRPLPFARLKIIEVCNVSLVISALETDLRMGVFFPCQIVVYQKKPKGKIFLVTVNPDFMPKALKNPNLKKHAFEVKKMIREVFDAVDF